MYNSTYLLSEKLKKPSPYVHMDRICAMRSTKLTSSLALLSCIMDSIVGKDALCEAPILNNNFCMSLADGDAGGVDMNISSFVAIVATEIF